MFLDGKEMRNIYMVELSGRVSVVGHDIGSENQLDKT